MHAHISHTFSTFFLRNTQNQKKQIHLISFSNYSPSNTSTRPNSISPRKAQKNILRRNSSLLCISHLNKRQSRPLLKYLHKPSIHQSKRRRRTYKHRRETHIIRSRRGSIAQRTTNRYEIFWGDTLRSRRPHSSLHRNCETNHH